MSVLIPYKLPELLIEIPPVSNKIAEAFAPVLPVTVQTPVKVPGVVAEPVVIAVVCSVPMLAVVIDASAIVALAEIVK